MKLEKVTQLFLIAVCVVSLVVLVKHGLLNNGTDAAGMGMSKYADTLVGQRETTIPVAAWQDSPNNLVLMLSSQCHFCQESIPLYQKLATLRRGDSDRFSLVAVGVEPPDVLREYLHRNKIDVDKVMQVRSGFAGITFTPAVFIVNSHGVIQKAFLGKLTTGIETQLLHLAAALKPIS